MNSDTPYARNWFHYYFLRDYYHHLLLQIYLFQHSSPLHRSVSFRFDANANKLHIVAMNIEMPFLGWAEHQTANENFAIRLYASCVCVCSSERFMSAISSFFVVVEDFVFSFVFVLSLSHVVRIVQLQYTMLTQTHWGGTYRDTCSCCCANETKRREWRGDGEERDGLRIF